MYGIQPDKMTRAYIASIQINTPDSCRNGITRMQLIELIDHRHIKPQEVNIIEIDSILETIKDGVTIPYGANTLALEWAADNDSIVYLKYISDPVRAIIYIYRDIPKRNRGRFIPTEIVWISEQHVFRYNQRFKSTDEIDNYVKEKAIKIELPAQIYNTSIIYPND